MRPSPFSQNCAAWLGSSAIALTALLGVSAARAASFDLVGTTQPYTLQSDFNPNWTAVPQGFSGSGSGTSVNILYSTPAYSTYAPTPTAFNTPTAAGAGLGITGTNGPVTLTYTYLGYNSSFINQFEPSFTYSSSPTFQNLASSNFAATPNGASFTTTTNLSSSGLVPLLFNSTAYGDSSGLAVNGGPIGSNVAMGFLIDPSNPDIAYALFKDSWQNSDGNFDNMIVEIQIDPSDPPATPLPAALPLFATGLGFIGAFRLRRKRGIQQKVA